MFQANVIQGDSLEFNALIYPNQHPNTLQYIHNSISQLPSMLTEQAMDIYHRAQQMYNQYYGSEARQRVFHAISNLNSGYQENIIYPIKTIEQSQAATLTMQRWIMAEPNIRTLYHNQQCDGFSDTYVDVEPGKIGEDHYDYRRAMDGIVRYDSDDIVTVLYADELRDGDRELDAYEQFMIQRTWETIKIAVSQMNDDPTNPFGGKL
jgi:hypothetical protein